MIECKPLSGGEFISCASGEASTLRWYRGAECGLWIRANKTAAALSGLSPDRCVWDIGRASPEYLFHLTF